MFLFRIFIFISLVIASLLTNTCYLYSQVSDDFFCTETQIKPENKDLLFLEIDNLSFFRNNETANIIVPGYTLPGFWFQAKATYQPLSLLKIEAGLHTLWYWGAEKYPAFAYSKISYWEDTRSTKKIHLLPFFRIQVALSKQVDIILGNIYGGANHRLITPLYNPELNLSNDPEAGLQILYKTSWLEMDTWINWETFIYKMDTCQEAFSYGLSSRFKVNKPDAPLHIYLPLQALAQHRGGQINDTDIPIQTMLNGSLGVGLDWNTRWKVLKKMNIECDLTGYYQHAGNMWPLKRGYGFYTSLMAELADFRIKTAYWTNENFISMYGNPYFGAPSMTEHNVYFKRPKMITLGAGYTRILGKGFALGIDFDIYHRRPVTVVDPQKGNYSMKAKTDYSLGIYLRANPSFFLKKI